MDSNGKTASGIAELLHGDVPLPGSVSGRRIVKLAVRVQDVRQDVPPSELFASLGFSRTSTGSWAYDRRRALDWFLGELRNLQYSWVQDPWVSARGGQPAQAESDAGPRSTRPTGAERSERPATTGTGASRRVEK